MSSPAAAAAALSHLPGLLPLADLRDLFLLCLSVLGMVDSMSLTDTPQVRSEDELGMLKWALGFTNFYITGTGDAGLHECLDAFVCSKHGNDLRAFLRRHWAGNPRLLELAGEAAAAGCAAPPGADDALAVAAAEARLQRDVREGCVRRWGVLGDGGRLYGRFAVMDFRADGAVLVSLDEARPRGFLVLGVSQSLDKIIGARARRIASGGTSSLVVLVTLLPFRGRIVSNGYVEMAPEAARVTAEMRAAAAAPAAALPEAPLPDLAPYSSWRQSNAASLAAEPPASAVEARSLAALIAQPRPRASGAWTLRRVGYTEAAGDNPNKLVSCMLENGMMGAMAQCKRIDPTPAELLRLLADVRKKCDALPEAVFVDAVIALPRVAALLKRTLGPEVCVFYYPPPSPEESRRIEAGGPPAGFGGGGGGGCPQQ